MREAIERHWASYFYSGSIALIVSWVLLITMSGCRVGNNEVDAPSMTGISGFYSTLPVSYTATISQSTGSVQQFTMNISSIPSDISGVFTNPTSLIAADLPSGLYGLTPITGSAQPFPVTVAANLKSFVTGGEIGLGPLPSPWNTDTQCQYNSALNIHGTINSLGAGDPTSVSTSLGVLNITGRIGAHITFETSFQGDCATSWAAMRDCYNTLTSCPGSTPAQQNAAQVNAQSIYEFWVLSGVLNPSDIATASDLRYDVIYQ